MPSSLKTKLTTHRANVIFTPHFVTLRCGNCGGLDYRIGVRASVDGKEAKVGGLQCARCGTKIEVDDQSNLVGSGRFNLEEAK
jgi:transcription elongation factor Elf1